LLEVRRLAAAHEAYVALLPERDNRAAAAFVAASAHQVCLLGSPAGQTQSHADGSSISPEVCASLLFLVAEAHADAAECAKRIAIDRDHMTPPEAALLTAIKALCMGRPSDVIRVDLPPLVAGDPAELAIEALHLELLKVIKSLAARLLTRIDRDAPAGGNLEFGRVKDLSAGALGDVLGTGESVFSLFPGPLHLANLLIAVERDLAGSALSRIPAPKGISEDG
jgi:hypothetical protein